MLHKKVFIETNKLLLIKTYVHDRFMADLIDPIKGIKAIGDDAGSTGAIYNLSFPVHEDSCLEMFSIYDVQLILWSIRCVV